MKIKIIKENIVIPKKDKNNHIILTVLSPLLVALFTVVFTFYYDNKRDIRTINYRSLEFEKSYRLNKVESFKKDYLALHVKYKEIANSINEILSSPMVYKTEEMNAIMDSRISGISLQISELESDSTLAIESLQNNLKLLNIENIHIDESSFKYTLKIFKRWMFYMNNQSKFITQMFIDNEIPYDKKIVRPKSAIPLLSYVKEKEEAVNSAYNKLAIIKGELFIELVNHENYLLRNDRIE